MNASKKILFPFPRVLPMTVLCMAGLLVVKSGKLIFPAIAETSAPHAATKQEIAKPTVPPAGQGPKTDITILEESKPKEVPASTSNMEDKNAIKDGGVTESERALLVDLRQRRVALEAREATIIKREQTFQAVEKRLAARIEELAELQKRLEDLERQRKERDEGSWRGLVRLYETMKPKDAAMIFNDLEASVLIPVLDRMKESKAAPIMSAMSPERARLVTTELASQRTKVNAAPGPTNGSHDSDVSPNKNSKR